jgi:hypothetical protein
MCGILLRLTARFRSLLLPWITPFAPRITGYDFNYCSALERACDTTSGNELWLKSGFSNRKSAEDACWEEFRRKV